MSVRPGSGRIREADGQERTPDGPCTATFSAGKTCCFMNCFTRARTSWPLLLCAKSRLSASACRGKVVLRVLGKRNIKRRLRRCPKSLLYISSNKAKSLQLSKTSPRRGCHPWEAWLTVLFVGPQWLAGANPEPCKDQAIAPLLSYP